MKKVLLVVAVIAAFGFASCGKKTTCVCKTYLNGVVMLTEESEIKKGSCSDFNQGITAGEKITAGIECSKK